MDMTVSAIANRPSLYPDFAVVAESAAYRRVLTALQRFAAYDQAPVLLEGESGTGKTLLANYIHRLSPRAERPFHSVMVGTLDDSLASSELFGHVAGAFTDARKTRKGRFVTSEGSTLLLDEIGKTSKGVQAKLLHAIEYREVTPVGSDTPMRVDVRIIAATNIPLSTLVAREEFLPDLAARFGYFRIEVPPLRERRADIPALIAHCLARRSLEFGYTSPPSVHPELHDVLCHAEWPTNLRGLDSAIRYILVNAEGANVLTIDHCAGALDDDVAAVLARRRGQLPAETAVLVKKAGSISAAARMLGVPRSTIQRRLRKNTDDQLASPNAPVNSFGTSAAEHL